MSLGSWNGTAVALKRLKDYNAVREFKREARTLWYADILLASLITYFCSDMLHPNCVLCLVCFVVLFGSLPIFSGNVHYHRGRSIYCNGISPKGITWSNSSERKGPTLSDRFDSYVTMHSFPLKTWISGQLGHLKDLPI